MREKDKGRASIVEDVEERQAASAAAATPRDVGERVDPRGASGRLRAATLRPARRDDGRSALRRAPRLHGAAATSRSDRRGRASASSRSTRASTPSRSRCPAAFDFDGSLRLWAAADLELARGRLTRSTSGCARCSSSYGSADSWYAGLGRMRYAASTLGTLDGLRVQATRRRRLLGRRVRRSGPEPARRRILGRRAALRRRGALQPPRREAPARSGARRARLDVRRQGSALRLDERRISAMFGRLPGALAPRRPRRGLELRQQQPVEGRARRAHRRRPRRVGAVRPARARRARRPHQPRALALARLVPAAVVVLPHGPGPARRSTEPCDGRTSMRATGAVNVGLTIKDFGVTLGGTAIGDVAHASSDPRVLGVFVAARLVRVAKVLRFDVTGNYSDASSVRIGGAAAAWASRCSTTRSTSLRTTGAPSSSSPPPTAATSTTTRSVE